MTRHGRMFRRHSYDLALFGQCFWRQANQRTCWLGLNLRQLDLQSAGFGEALTVRESVPKNQ
jgi:hypothetical protein